MRLSVIIPVYNVEKYIERCVHSLQNQDIPKNDYEIIIINDGSPDNSRELILQLMKRYSNIVFIEQTNKGVSMARNAGIDKARGKYLLFIDPDDYVEHLCFNGALNKADDQIAQITFLGYKFLNLDGSVRKAILFADQEDKLYGGIEMYSLSRGDGTTDPDRSWAILFERDFINNFDIRYLANVPYLEDGEVIARALCVADRCIFGKSSFYLRTTRKGSATNSNLFYSDRAIDGFFNAAINLDNFKKKGQLNIQQTNFINRPIVKFTLLTIQACVGRKSYSKYRSVKKRLLSNSLKKLELKGCSGSFYKYGFIYNISINLFCCFWFIKLLLISINNKIAK
jgi:glycosyltransferase involved in cell wall biosynthesis